MLQREPETEQEHCTCGCKNGAKQNKNKAAMTEVIYCE